MKKTESTPSNSESFSERAKKRRETWALEAKDAEGNIVETNGKSTEDVEPSVANIYALEEIRYMCYPELSAGLRLDKTKTKAYSKKTG